MEDRAGVRQAIIRVSLASLSPAEPHLQKTPKQLTSELTSPPTMSAPTQASAPSRKRPPTSTPPQTSNDRKRVRLTTARSIATLASTPSIQSGLLDVPSFIASRQFEIAALTRAMRSSKASNTQRAFQSVPRDLRRRTASHNPARIPHRLRKRAKHEMKEDNTAVHTMRQHKKNTRKWIRAETAEKLRNAVKKREVGEVGGREVVDVLMKPPRGHSRYRKRQKEKTWLPTHVWHAKRAHMGVRWGFAVAESCNEKSYRKTARAADGVAGAVAWDESYFSEILVRGTEAVLEELVGKLTGGVEVGRKVREGKRCWTGLVYEDEGFPTKPIAPVVLIWDPSTPGLVTRQFLLRVHPAAFKHLWDTLQLLTIPTTPKATLTDLRYEIGSISITGPTSTDALLSIFRPVDPSDPTFRLFANLTGLSSPSALPPPTLLSLPTTDPRLHFPPRLPPAPAGDATHRLFTTTTTLPLPTPKPFPLLAAKARCTSVRLQASQKRISRRKSAVPPGSTPPPLPTDPHIPILLYTTRNTWTLLAPWKHITPLWHSLQRTPDTRFGGLREAAQTHFEMGLPYFPTDYPGTDAGRAAEEQAATQRREHWGRRPPAKRTNYDAVRIHKDSPAGEHGDWACCDWKKLLGGDDDEAWLVPRRMMMQSQLPKGGVAMVKITLADKGRFSTTARVYLCEEAGEWGQYTARGKKGKCVKPGEKGYPECPSETDLVGFITAGNYRMGEGRCGLVAGVLWERVRGRKWVVVRDVGEGVGRGGRVEMLD